MKQDTGKSAEENIEQPKNKTSTTKVITSSKRSSEDDSVLQPKKFSRKLVNPAQDRPLTNKDKTKKYSKKAVGTVSGKDASSLVGGEA